MLLPKFDGAHSIASTKTTMPSLVSILMNPATMIAQTLNLHFQEKRIFHQLKVWGGDPRRRGQVVQDLEGSNRKCEVNPGDAVEIINADMRAGSGLRN